MPRQLPLSKLLTSLRARIGASLTNPASGSGIDTQYMQLLSDKQQWLAGEYDWPFLEDRFDIAVAPFQRYLSFPTLDDEGDATAMNLERPYIVERLWSQKWDPVEYGIGAEQFNYINSDIIGNYQDPIQRWRWSQEGKFEVWPIPVSIQTVRFTGQRALDTLTQLTDTADLDDQLIWLSVAADLLERSNQKDAASCRAQFQRRLASIRAAYPAWKKANFGESADDRSNIRPVGIKVGIAAG